MSTMGNIAVEGYIKELLKFLRENEKSSAEDRIGLLTHKLQTDRDAAKDGWL